MKISFKILLLLFVLAFPIASVKGQSCIGPAGQVKWAYWGNFVLFDYVDLDDLSVLDTYPNRPDATQILNSLRSPINHTDYYAGMIRGFIKVPTTDNYIFNLTSDDKGLFFLSTNQSPANKVKRAEVLSQTLIDQHTKEAGQTSVSIQLTGGQYYYFEMYNFEGRWDDHMTLYWKKASTPAAPWEIVGEPFIYEYTCGQVCPDRGTPCNDGNAATTDDKQDGLCNCVGVYATANACVGERGLVEAYYYDNIPGSLVENDLVNAPKFPYRPIEKKSCQPLPARFRLTLFMLQTGMEP